MSILRPIVGTKIDFVRRSLDRSFFGATVRPLYEKAYAFFCSSPHSARRRSESSFSVCVRVFFIESIELLLLELPRHYLLDS
jgi:hypothetical protein